MRCWSGLERLSGDFLLEPFAKQELDEVAVLVEDAADAVSSLVTDGLSVTQSRYTKGGVRER